MTIILRETWSENFMIFLSYVYTLRLIGPISYLDECDLMVHWRKHIVIFSRMHFVDFVTFVRVYNMHQDTKSARLIAVCKRTLTLLTSTKKLLTRASGIWTRTFGTHVHVHVFACLYKDDPVKELKHCKSSRIALSRHKNISCT